MVAYFETMDEFLAVQQEIMAAYLKRSSNESSPPEIRASSDQPNREIQDAKATAPLAPTPNESAPASSPTCASLETILLEKVATRTGYPREMLGLDLDLEADLGIDSIKRVEILGDLQGHGLVPHDLDKDALTQSRTLRQLLDRLDVERPNVGGEPRWPWIGEVRSLQPGVKVIAERRLDLRSDPIAEHHTLGGRRVSAVDRERKGLPVVPFTVMAEMLAEAAALLVPGRAWTALREITAHRWIPYESEPVTLVIEGYRDPSRPEEVRVTITNRGNSGPSARPPGDGPVVEGTVVFADSRSEAPIAGDFTLEAAGPSNFTADQLYHEGWLFHGPALQGLARVGLSAPSGIEGTIRVLSHRPILTKNTTNGLLTDVIVLDSFTHLLGCWSLDQLQEGEVVFPLRLTELTIHGEDPPEGTEVACRIQVRDVERYRLRADAEIVRPDGRVWMRLQGWEDWRFYWPHCYRDQFRMPEHTFLGERLEVPSLPSDAVAVWLEPPADFARPIWSDVLEAVQLDPEERSELRALPGPRKRRTSRLWGRVAAKEAVRRVLADRGSEPHYPADLVIVADRYGRPRLRSRLTPEAGEEEASVSIAHTEGVAIALAALSPEARVGIDVERIVDRETGFEELAFSESERSLLDQLTADGTSRAEWVARFWCAKEAAGKSTGRGLMVGPASVEVLGWEVSKQSLCIALGPDLRAACPEWSGSRRSVSSLRREANLPGHGRWEKMPMI